MTGIMPQLPYYNNVNFQNEPFQLCSDGIFKFEPPTVKYKKLHENAKPPKRSKPGDAGYDLYALQDMIVPSLFKNLYQMVLRLTGWSHNDGDKDYLVTKIETGIGLQIPTGHVGLIWDRSGMGSRLIKVFGGVIDETYRGDVTVCLANFSFTDYHVKAGDRIAQIVIQRYEDYAMVESEELSETERGDGGFGSSGK